MSKASPPEFSQPLSSLYKHEYEKMEYHALIKACESVDFVVNKEMSNRVERETVGQFRSKLWFKYRAGITASKMKSVCSIDSSNPSQSVIKSVCYPELFSFTSKATSWGCTHENVAKQTESRQLQHDQKHLPLVRVQEEVEWADLLAWRRTFHRRDTNWPHHATSPSTSNGD